ncbi:MAG TPA: hypothetical protein VFG73_02155 [Rhodanobacteraceae bacterium]|nr:hypothetical protein [Rhodanobacteraceae bacterium]
MNDWVLLVLWLYYLPLVVCALGFAVRTGRDYQRDVAARAAAERTHRLYAPELTIGTLLGRAVLTFVPVLNVLTAVFAFALGRRALIRALDWIWTLTDVPLVPRKR